MKMWTAICVVFTCLVGVVQAQDNETTKAFLASLNFQRGHIELPGGHASLNIPEQFRYLDPEDTERVLTQAWGNPPGSDALGMIVPSDIGLLDENGWAVVIQYEEDGYVSDEDAGEIDYDSLLKEMQKSTAEANEEREKNGYGRVELIGWAAPPHYDQPQNKMYWAKEIAFDDSQTHTLNYNIRVLGRKGVLILNAVAGMSQINQITDDMQDVLDFANFDKGYQYADFNPDNDHVAAYGLGALVAGTVAAKAGLFAKLGVMLLAMKKFLIVAVLAIGAFFKKLFGGNK